MVTLSPSGPGPQRIGQACSAPYADARVALRATNGALVDQTSTGADGRFRLYANQGTYELHIDTQGAFYPRCGTVTLTVRTGHITHVNLDCDTGMR